MSKRVITGLIITAVLLLLIFCIGDTLVFPMLFTLAAGIAEFEIIRCIGIHKNLAVTIPMCIIAIATPICCYFAFDTNNTEITSYLLFGICILLCLYLFTISVFAKGKIDVSQIFGVIATTVYIIGAFVSMIYLNRIHTVLWPIPIVSAWVSDTFAFFTGKLFGKHKLVPEISPKKTVEGSIGGIIWGTGAVLFYGFLMTVVPSIKSNVDFLLLAIAGLAMSFISQIGDLMMSVVKRHYGIKDFGKILPGHGGILDRFDSVLPNAIVFAAFVRFTQVFNF